MRPPVLVGYAPRRADKGPARFAAALGRRLRAPVILTAAHDGPGMPPGFETLAGELHDTGVDLRTEVIRHASPSRALAALIADRRPALVVMGSTSRGRFGRVRPGGTAERLIRGAPCPVAVVPRGHERPETGMRAIGAAFTSAGEGREVLTVATALARALHGRLRVVMALDPHHAQEQGYWDPAEGLVDESHRLDLVVMGSPRGASRRVLEHAACPSIVLPRAAHEGLDVLIGAVDDPARSRDSGLCAVGASAIAVTADGRR